MPITFDEALQATDPNLDDTEKGPDGLTARGRSAMQILNGVRANEVYWDHRPELEALRAQAEGHGVIRRGGEDSESEPAAVVGAGVEPAIEGTSEEVPPPAVPLAAASAGSATTRQTSAQAAAQVPSPDNPNDAIARLRAQVETLGGTPEA